MWRNILRLWGLRHHFAPSVAPNRLFPSLSPLPALPCSVPKAAHDFNFALTNGGGAWDNNDGHNYEASVSQPASAIYPSSAKQPSTAKQAPAAISHEPSALSQSAEHQLSPAAVSSAAVSRARRIESVDSSDHAAGEGEVQR